VDDHDVDVAAEGDGKRAGFVDADAAAERAVDRGETGGNGAGRSRT
jgi:hypothetical protein